MDDFNKLIYQYDLYLPTTEDVLECIEYSTKLYWTNKNLMYKLAVFVETLSPQQKAAFLYIGDLYHLRKHNTDFVYTLISKLSHKSNILIDNPIATIKEIDEQVINYASLICSEEIKGLGKNYTLMDEKGVLNTLVATARNIENTLDEYSNLITILFSSNTIPNSIAYIRSMVRRAVVLSDTDSTMFSTDDYVRWYFGKIVFTPESLAVAGSIMFLTTQAIANGLHMFSANIGVAKENMNILAMKPEFSFPVFAQTSVAKHYFALKNIQEGNVYAEPDIEIKGVHLKTSAAPPELTRRAHEKLSSILFDTLNNKNISIKSFLSELGDLEREIKASILNGETKYLRVGSIKDVEAYSGPINQSPYVHHLLWKEVFEHTYGKIDNPPYSVIKVPINLINKSELNKWVDNIADKDFSNRMKVWISKYNKDRLGTIYINLDFTRTNGIPKEFVSAIDSKKIILELTKSYRMMAETLGYYLKVDRLAMESGY
jgi:hypothetical protein